MRQGEFRPQLSVVGEADPERIERLRAAYEMMSEIATIVWPDRPNWRGAIVGLSDADDVLSVTWRDEDDFDLFAPVAELAWAGACEGSYVRHENADPDGLRLPARELAY